MNTKKIFFFLACFTSMQAFAQRDTTANTLDPVIITANKFEQKQNETGKMVTIISSEELRKNAGRLPGELLDALAGIQVNGNTNTLGSTQTIYMRGASSGHSLLLLDGIPLYDASGISSAFDLNYLNTSLIERIEILKGAQSTLYGSDAMAGVINIITKKNTTEKFGGNAVLSGGSYGTAQASAGIYGDTNGWEYKAGYGLVHSDGFSSAADSTNKANYEHDGFTMHNVLASIGKNWNHKFSLRFFGLYNAYKADIDAGAFVDDKDYTIVNTNLQTGAEMKYNWKQNTLRFHYGFNKVSRSYVDDSTDVPSFAKYQSGMYKGYSHYAELYGNFFLHEKINLVAGLDYRNNSTDQHYLSISAFGPYETGLGDSARTSQESIYASLIIKSISKLTLEAGGRLNHHSIYGYNGTYSFNPSYDFDSHWKIFANLASAYHVPTLYQLYGEYGNKELHPEQAQSLEAGLHYQTKKTNVTLTGFTRKIDNNIVFFTDPVTYAGKYINAGTQYAGGMEISVNQILSGKISLDANYTYMDGKMETSSDFTGKDTSFFNLYRRPQHVLHVSVQINPWKKLNLRAGIKWASHSFEPVYMSAPIEMPGYYLLHADVDYTFNEKMACFVNLNNITNQQYEEIRGFATKGFNVMAGVRVAF